jgi:hypothetical protein
MVLHRPVVLAVINGMWLTPAEFRSRISVTGLLMEGLGAPSALYIEGRVISTEDPVKDYIRRKYNSSRNHAKEAGHFLFVFTGHWLRFRGNWVLGKAKSRATWHRRATRNGIFSNVTRDTAALIQSV